MPEIVYALVPLLKDHDGHHGLEEFEPGDIITGHYTPERLAWFIEHDQASVERPTDVKPAYSLIDGLTYNGPGAGATGRRHFQRGDRIDGIVPASLVRVLIGRDEASYTKPKEG